MRFSSIFQIPLAQRDPAPPLPFDAPQPVPAAKPAPVDLPDDLDQRVRMVGEWQLGEAC